MKVKSVNVAGVQIHNERKREHSNTNPDIDFSKSKNNYHLKNAPERSYNACIEKKIQQGRKSGKALRKDAVKLCEVLFTSDTDFFKGLSKSKQREFFQACYDFTAKKYGEQNIVSAVVHLDETTPHLHIDFVPLTADGRLSAKDVVGERKDLQALQDEAFQEVFKSYNLDRGERADLDAPEKPKQHKTTKQYKADKVRERVKELLPEAKPIFLSKNLTIPPEGYTALLEAGECIAAGEFELKRRELAAADLEQSNAEQLSEIKIQRSDAYKEISELSYQRTVIDREKRDITELRVKTDADIQEKYRHQENLSEDFDKLQGKYNKLKGSVNHFGYNLKPVRQDVLLKNISSDEPAEKMKQIELTLQSLDDTVQSSIDKENRLLKVVEEGLGIKLRSPFSFSNPLSEDVFSKLEAAFRERKKEAAALQEKIRDVDARCEKLAEGLQKAAQGGELVFNNQSKTVFSAKQLSESQRDLLSTISNTSTKILKQAGYTERAKQVEKKFITDAELVDFYGISEKAYERSRSRNNDYAR
jgi:hypothetical protein